MLHGRGDQLGRDFQRGLYVAANQQAGLVLQHQFLHANGQGLRGCSQLLVGVVPQDIRDLAGRGVKPLQHLDLKGVGVFAVGLLPARLLRTPGVSLQQGLHQALLVSGHVEPCLPALRL